MKKFGLSDARHKHTHTATHVKLTKDDQGVTVDQSIYRSMNVSLLYLNASDLDIMLSMGVCTRYQANPKIHHPTQV